MAHQKKFTNNRLSPQNEKGSFLLSTLLFMGVISIVFTSVWQLVSHKQTNWTRTKSLNSRDLAMTSALRNSRVSTFYYKTILENDPVNSMFIKCMQEEGAANDCISTSGAGKIWYAMKLIDENNQVIVGSASNPVLYDVFGRVCSTPSPTCPFEVSSIFTPACESGASACAQAETIDVTITVRIHSTVENLFTGMSISTTVQTISISDFENYLYPVLPPVTSFGAPVSGGAGEGGYINVQIANAASGGSGSGSSSGSSGSSSGGPGSGGPAPAPPPPSSACKPGQGASAKGGCKKFRL